jgi:hypothetical protein
VAVRAEVDRICRAALGVEVAKPLFRSTAVGDVFGVRLVDGRGVVLKVHQQRESAETLAAVKRVQAYHYRAGFPCPEPLAGPVPVGDRYATVESLVVDGEMADTRRPDRRRAIAEALVERLDLARECGQRRRCSAAGPRIPRTASGRWRRTTRASTSSAVPKARSG